MWSCNDDCIQPKGQQGDALLRGGSEDGDECFCDVSVVVELDVSADCDTAIPRTATAQDPRSKTEFKCLAVTSWVLF